MTAVRTTIKLSSRHNPATTCKPVVFSITVDGAGGTTPTGKVVLTKGSTVLVTATLRRGVARMRASKLVSGENVLNATYNGDGKYAAATSTPYSQMMPAACK